MKSSTLLWVLGGVAVVGAATTAAVLITKKSIAASGNAGTSAGGSATVPTTATAPDASVELASAMAPMLNARAPVSAPGWHLDQIGQWVKD